MTTNVMVLGGSGMLGAMLVDVLQDSPDIHVTATAREGPQLDAMRRIYSDLTWRTFDALRCWELDAAQIAAGYDFIVNAIGITKPFIHDDNPLEISRALQVNSQFPDWLGRLEVPILQIATDCVYSGASGGYIEQSPHDALDVYGKTKSLGESYWPAMHHLRCSIIGPEVQTRKFLLEWFLQQPRAAEVSGFANHNWNGVTTLHFARICAGVIQQRADLSHLQHVLPAAPVTKYRLLQLFGAEFGRPDIKVNPTEAGYKIDRTLATCKPETNAMLWRSAGYAGPPTIEQMVAELAAYKPRFRTKPGIA